MTFLERDINLCRDCQQQRPAYVAGVMYARCLDCLDAAAAKRAANKTAKQARLHAKIAQAGKG